VLALFAGPPSGPEGLPQFQTEQTADGGRHWSATQLPCPSVGPCVRWGPAPTTITGMGAPRPQWQVYSRDGGRTWLAPSSPASVDLRSPPPHELVALSPTRVALVGGEEPSTNVLGPPLWLSDDGGQTWQQVGLPNLPGQAGPPFSWPGLILLPDGALLAQSPDTADWLRLEPAGRAWCPVAAAPQPEPGTAQVIGERLWMLRRDPNGAAPPTPRSVPLADLRCASTGG
jgi:hypothetical protein